jgi:thioredoxin 1
MRVRIGADMKELIAAAASLGLILFAALAFSAAIPSNQAQLDAARASGKPTAAFHADWCPTCRAQAPLRKDLRQTPEFSQLTLYIADYDQETDPKKSLGVSRQSTLVVFKRSHEVARSTGHLPNAILTTTDVAHWSADADQDASLVSYSLFRNHAGGPLRRSPALS